ASPPCEPGAVLPPLGTAAPDSLPGRLPELPPMELALPSEVFSIQPCERSPVVAPRASRPSFLSAVAGPRGTWAPPDRVLPVVEEAASPLPSGPREPLPMVTPGSVTGTLPLVAFVPGALPECVWPCWAAFVLLPCCGVALPCCGAPPVALRLF